jgi:hypothetical protein
VGGVSPKLDRRQDLLDVGEVPGVVVQPGARVHHRVESTLDHRADGCRLGVEAAGLKKIHL